MAGIMASIMASSSSAATPLRILCFGDSLTSGYCHFGLTERPYSLVLQKRLSAAFPDTDIQVFTDGLPSGRVSGTGFTRRLRTEGERRPYDWVIILGGTNDLACQIPVERIYEALADAWDVALSQGSKVLALTVPECHAKVRWLNDNRDTLNSSIKSHRQTNFQCFDLRPKVPFHSLAEGDRRKYWDDGLHLTRSGYDWMGDHIADAFLQILSEDIQPQQPSAKKLASRQDEVQVLEEEAGSPKEINQGYVVVRKRDLN